MDQSRSERQGGAPERGDLEYAALCPAGFEELLAGELRGLGCGRVRALRGSVAFFGGLREGYRACLWSRLASRIVLVIARVDCQTTDDLYDACLRDVAWEEHVGPHATIAVEARGGSRDIRDMRFAALRVKDAVCDRLRDARGARPYVDAEEPDVAIVCTVREGKATVGIDLGGSSLIDHGYRVPARGRAAAGRSSFVREDMAALMLELGGWGKACARTDRSRLVDPLGSSPTLVLEAACVACRRAPRLTRRHWGFTGWEGHDGAVWAEELAEAQRRFDAARACGARVTVACTDAGVRAEIAEMARRAGVADAIEVLACGPAALDLGERQIPDAFVVCAMPDAGGANLMGDLPARLAAVAALTRSAALAEAPVTALTASDLLSFTLGLEPEACCKVINGSQDAKVVVFPSAARAARMAAQKAAGGDAAAAGARDGRQTPAVSGPSAARDASVVTAQLPQITLADGTAMSVLVPASDQFAARLAKVAKLRAKWASREGVSCYRVYDADLPDYAVTVDLYRGGAMTPGTWLVMSEYAAPREIDEGLAARRLADALAIAPRVLGVDPENVFLKVRRRAKGGSQYAEHDRQGRTALVEEGGLVFEVNFSDYLDTGLFLDHRLVRSMIRDMAGRARFLNLFAYTGAASCYAADGDAYQTTTVDLSNTYLTWARRNMEQNGFAGPQHEFVQADVLKWVAEQRRTANRWNLIYIDPPTFSNSARMRTRGFDVQEDHAELLIGASRLLARGGTIVFSCNLRGFTPDVEKLAGAGVAIEDITARTIPEDFARNAKVHHCYLVRRSN